MVNNGRYSTPHTESRRHEAEVRVGFTTRLTLMLQEDILHGTSRRNHLAYRLDVNNSAKGSGCVAFPARQSPQTG